MTEAEWIEVFSALMTGADLSYPEKSHQVVWNLLRNLEFPVSMEKYGSFADFWGLSFTKQVGAALVMTIDAAQQFNHVWGQGIGASGDYINTDAVYLAKGSYIFRYLHLKSAAYGIAKIGAFDGAGHSVAIASVDQYSAATVRNAVAFGFFTLPNDGAWQFDKLVNTRNAANTTGWSSQFTLLQIQRYG